MRETVDQLHGFMVYKYDKGFNFFIIRQIDQIMLLYIVLSLQRCLASVNAMKQTCVSVSHAFPPHSDLKHV